MRDLVADVAVTQITGDLDHTQAKIDVVKSRLVRDYGYAWTAFRTTYDKPNGKVWDIYSDVPGGTPGTKRSGARVGAAW